MGFRPQGYPVRLFSFIRGKSEETTPSSGLSTQVGNVADKFHVQPKSNGSSTPMKSYKKVLLALAYSHADQWLGTADQLRNRHRRGLSSLST